MNDAPQRGVTVVSTLQFTWGVTVCDFLSGSRLNSRSSCSYFWCESWLYGEFRPFLLDSFSQSCARSQRQISSPQNSDPQIQESGTQKENVMLNPAHEIHQAQNVHELLLSTVKQVRALHATLSALMTDVAAIRRTLLH